jgi:cell division protein FtsB
MQSEIDETDLLQICIARLEVKNSELRKKFAEIEARNAKLKAGIAKLENNELIKNLMTVSCDKTVVASENT